MPTNLFSHPSRRGNIVQFRAGLLKKEGNLVTADPRKGYVQVTDDGGALVVRWIDRTTQVTEDVAHLYPGQATISRVEKCTTGRVYVIKFLDCDREEFFWFQEPSEDKDQEWIDSIKKKLCGDNEPSGRLSTRMHLDRTRNPNGHTSRPQVNDLQLLQQLLFQGSDGSHSQMQQELLELLSGSSGIGLSSSTTSSPSPNLTSVSQGVVNREEPVSPQIGTTTGVSTSALTVDTCLTQLIASREVREAIQENPLRYVAAVAETLPTRPREDGSDLIRHLRNPQVQDTASLLQEALRDPEGYSEICAAFNVSINRSSGVSSVRSFLEALCDENTEKAPETD